MPAHQTMTQGPARRVCLLGASGSIGASTLDLIARHPQTLRLHCAVAWRDEERMEAICRRHRPAWVVMADAEAAQGLRARLADLDPPIEVQSGSRAVLEAATESASDTVVAAIVGAAGLAPTLAAVQAGKRVLLANKEALVCAGSVFMRALRASGALLLPIDSEHNAIFQCLPQGGAAAGQGDDVGRPPAGLRRIWLTASGGPFRGWSRQQLQAVTPEQAQAHPNWSMGPKISVDSATLMNKGLEVIEAQVLFGLAVDDIRVLLHPQSALHSLVEYVDGSFLAQLGSADMRIPIAHALAWPERCDSGAASLDLAALARLDFAEPDREAFPCLDLAYQALRSGGSAPTVLNAANEEAVAAFLNGRLGFLEIAEVVNEALNRCPLSSVDELEAVLAADAAGRRAAQAAMRALQGS